MTWRRVLGRNRLWGYYTGRSAREEQPGSCWSTLPGGPDISDDSDWPINGPMLRGDLRRVENDQRDERHLAEYAARTGLPPEQCKAVLDLFFEGDF